MALVVDDAELGFEVALGLAQCRRRVLVLAAGTQLHLEALQLRLHGALLRFIARQHLARRRAAAGRLARLLELHLERGLLPLPRQLQLLGLAGAPAVELVGLRHHVGELGLDPLQVDLELVLLGREPLLAAGPFLGFAAALAGEVGVQRFDLFVVLLGRGQAGRRFGGLLLEGRLLLGERRLAALPVLLQRLDFGQERRALVAQPLELSLGLVEVGPLPARLFQLRLEQLAIGFVLAFSGLRALLQPGDIRDQPLPLGLPLLAGGLEWLDLALDGLQLLLQLRRQALQPRLLLGELDPRLLPFLLQLRLLGDRGVAILQ